MWQFVNRHCSRRHHNKHVEISLFCSGYLFGWIWKCSNLLFRFCHLIGFHSLGSPAFSKRTVCSHPLLTKWAVFKVLEINFLITVILNLIKWSPLVTVTICEVSTGLVLLFWPVLNGHTESITCSYSFKKCNPRDTTNDFLVYFCKSLKHQK